MKLLDLTSAAQVHLVLETAPLRAIATLRAMDLTTAVQTLTKLALNVSPPLYANAPNHFPSNLTATPPPPVIGNNFRGGGLFFVFYSLAYYFSYCRALC